MLQVGSQGRSQENKKPDFPNTLLVISGGHVEMERDGLKYCRVDWGQIFILDKRPSAKNDRVIGTMFGSGRLQNGERYQKEVFRQDGR